MHLLSFILLAVVSLVSVTYVNGLAVMSVDLGSESMKIGIVSPGVPMEIVLNKESKRKTPAVVSFRDNVRTFGEDAQTIGIRFPKNSYSYLIDLLAKEINHPVVKLYQSRFPYYKIVEDTQRGTILFQHDEDTFYSPEELIAQLLSRAKEFAEHSAQQPIKECVLTVPGYFNQAERKALLQAAQLANLKVLQLINDYTAVALNYGIFRIKDFNETTQYVMFYDMGASSTSATIVSYQTIKTKERGYLETHPQLSIIGVGYDRTLGGLEIQLRLRDYLAKKFNEMKKTSNDVFKNPRAMAKLFKEAGRLKNVLSANTDHFAQIEGLLDDIDFKLRVTREELEEICQDLFDRVGAPVEQALKMAGLSTEVLNQVVLFGAGTRVPKVQEKLQKIAGQELAKNINTDEAATMGAVYKAADLSTGFQVKKFITKDGVIFPIQVIFERESEGAIKQVKRILFGLMNPYPQKKIITFNKHTHDFTFNVNYAEFDHLPQNEILNLGALNLTVISLEGVADAINKNKGDNIESKGIKAHFSLDESGVLKLINVELVVEKTVPPEAEKEEEEGPFSKLGSTISKLFTGETEPEKPVHETPEEKPEEAAEAPEEKEPVEKPVNETTKKNETATPPKNATEKESAKDAKPKVVTLKEPIKAAEKILYIDKLNKKQLDESYKKLEKLTTIDRELNRRATALNNLESFVIDAQNKLYEDEFTQAATEEEIEKIRTACSTISDWLYEDGSDADADTYESKLNDLRLLTRDLYGRVFEHRERPEALNALRSMLNGSNHFLESAKNLTKSTNPEKDIFTDVEIEMLQKVINETQDWMDKMVEDQEKIKKSEPVKLTVKLISEKMAMLDREVKYLVNKLKIWKPKKTEKPKEDKNKTTDTGKEEQKASEGSGEKAEGEDKEKVEETVENPEVETEDDDDDDSVKTDDTSDDSHTEL
ncbi:hypothetical protein ILUMI_06537 [Ignelater luminosus]|uniref:Hypoxia up-regulated protein 1 n=1 Tax=Ignelater luminosus TaxID=2038154 RepID=A0A8K0DAG5_IGNLU|nr:hypothetical protein ILUMI_06537 [Ignelater luminosus]